MDRTARKRFPVRHGPKAFGTSYPNFSMYAARESPPTQSVFGFGGLQPGAQRLRQRLATAATLQYTPDRTEAASSDPNSLNTPSSCMLQAATRISWLIANSASESISSRSSA